MSGRRRHPRDAEDEVFELVREHAAELLRFARRYSLCADDAQEAYQRAMEILLRRMRSEPPASPLSWLRTVIRNECGHVREQRLRDVGYDEAVADDYRAGDHFDDPAERAERFEDLAHVAEALRRLKPQEVTALAMRAEGLTYEEICSRTGWTYTKTNRAVTEGRRSLLARLRAIETGAECERWVPLLSLLADGEASARELAELRPHLRGCSACRATLRTFHDVPRQIGELVPTVLLPVAAAGMGGSGLGLGRQLEAFVQAALERLAFGAVRVQGAVDALPSTKLVAVAASTAAIAGGGAAIDQVAKGEGQRPGAQRQQIAAADRRPGLRPAAMAPGALTPIVGGRAGAPAGRRAGAVATTAARGVSSGPVPEGEFGFESTAAGSRPARDRDPATVAAAAASGAGSAAAGRSAPSGPSEFRSQPPPQAAVAAAPSSPVPAPSAPRTAEPPLAEFAGP